MISTYLSVSNAKYEKIKSKTNVEATRLNSKKVVMNLTGNLLSHVLMLVSILGRKMNFAVTL